MSQQNNGTLYFVLAFFMVLAVGMGVAWAMSSSGATASATALAQATREKSDAEASVRRLNDEKETLLNVIGLQGEVGAVASEIQEKLNSDRFNKLTDAATGLNPALDNAGTARDIQSAAAISRQVDLQNKNDELQRVRESKDAEIQVHKDAHELAEQERQKQDAKHSERIDEIQEQFEKLRTTFENAQKAHSTYFTEAERRLSFLEGDVRDKRQAIQALRNKLFKQDDISFSTPDGVISSVDQVNGFAYVNLGRKDEVRVGTTFSVYLAANGGIGRRNTRDIKASIEIVSVMGPHLSEAKITEQDLHRPIANGDPVYSPIFTAGLPVEVAIGGLIDFDGSPGSDRDELLRMIVDQGGRVAVQVNDDGEFITQNGETMSDEDAENSISAKTRFLIIADLGETATDDSKDETRLLTYREIQLKTGKLQLQAENHGVYEIGLATFLEFLGYTRKRVAWRAGQEFNARLVNGARSRTVNGSVGQRLSTGVVSGAYAPRRGPRAESQGAVSELFR
jgi:hypothetical protein